jgi:hypothetical protein
MITGSISRDAVLVQVVDVFCTTDSGNFPFVEVCTIAGAQVQVSEKSCSSFVPMQALTEWCKMGASTVKLVVMKLRGAAPKPLQATTAHVGSAVW